MKRLRLLGATLAVGLGTLAGAQTTPPQLAPPDANRPRLVSPGTSELGALVVNHELTIDEAIGIALSTNRAYATAVAGLERASGRTGQARSALNPQAGLNGQFTEYDKPVTANFGGNDLILTNQFTSIFNASISLPIDITGAIRSAVRQAQFNEVAARIEVNRARNQLVYDVRNAFYQALRAQGQLVVAEDSLTNATTRLEDAQSALKAETGTQFDVLTAQRDVADAQQAVVSARGGVTLALGLLKSAMGIDISTPVKITDTGAVEQPAGEVPVVTVNTPAPTLPTAGDVPQVPATPDPSLRFHTVQNEVELGADYLTAVEEAIVTRPEVLESNAVLTAAEKGVTYARRSSLPSFAVTAGYVVQPNAAGFTPERQGTLGLSVNFPIFDGGLARAREREAKAEVSNAKTNRRAAIDGVTLDVQQAYVNLVQARERAHVVNVGVAQAREAFRLARLRAIVGVSASPQISPQLELGNAQATLTQAETNRVNALYDYNIARAQLDRAIGRFSYGPGSGYPTVPGPSVTGQPG
ncbi:MAG: TolC family protein, partial [Caulobacteraceae bacterium]